MSVEPSDTTGLYSEQVRQTGILSDMRRDISDQTISVALMEKAVEDVRSEMDKLRRIIQGSNGEHSLIVRMSVVEQGHVFMSSSLHGVTEGLEAIQAQLNTRSAEARAEQRQLFLAIISVFVTVLVAAGGVIVTLLHKGP